MTENNINYKINKGIRKIGVSGQVIEEEYLIIEAKTKKECEDMFKKEWDKK